MGEFLSTPLKDKQSEDGENSQVSLIKPNFKKKKIASLRFMCDARMEKKNGRCTYDLLRLRSK